MSPQPRCKASPRHEVVSGHPRVTSTEVASRPVRPLFGQRHDTAPTTSLPLTPPHPRRPTRYAPGRVGVLESTRPVAQQPIHLSTIYESPPLALPPRSPPPFRLDSYVRHAHRKVRFLREAIGFASDHNKRPVTRPESGRRLRPPGSPSLAGVPVAVVADPRSPDRWNVFSRRTGAGVVQFAAHERGIRDPQSGTGVGRHHRRGRRRPVRRAAAAAHPRADVVPAHLGLLPPRVGAAGAGSPGAPPLRGAPPRLPPAPSLPGGRPWLRSLRSNRLCSCAALLRFSLPSCSNSRAVAGHCEPGKSRQGVRATSLRFSPCPRSVGTAGLPCTGQVLPPSAFAPQPRVDRCTARVIE